MRGTGDVMKQFRGSRKFSFVRSRESISSNARSFPRRRESSLHRHLLLYSTLYHSLLPFPQKSLAYQILVFGQTKRVSEITRQSKPTFTPYLTHKFPRIPLLFLHNKQHRLHTQMFPRSLSRKELLRNFAFRS